MRSDKQIDREIAKACDFVNSFPNYDPTNAAQTLGFAVLNALEWARGKRVEKPSERWGPLAWLTKVITKSGMTARGFARAYNGPEGDAAADKLRGK